MSVTTGQFFKLLLLAATPTALGRALNNNPTTIADWNRALTATDSHGNYILDDATVISTLSGILMDGANAPVLNALLTQISYQNQMVPQGQVIAQIVWGIGITSGVLNMPWSSPPHPRGTTDITNLIASLAALANYDDTN